MTIQIKRFGEILTSRTEGREAGLLLLANELRTSVKKIELDFAGVLVMTPSWLGELVNTLNEVEARSFSYLNVTNASVKASVETTEGMPGSSSGS